MANEASIVVNKATSFISHDSDYTIAVVWRSNAFKDVSPQLNTGPTTVREQDPRTQPEVTPQGRHQHVNASGGKVGCELATDHLEGWDMLYNIHFMLRTTFVT